MVEENEVIKPIMVKMSEQGEKKYYIELPAETVAGVAKSILILNNIRQRNFLTREEIYALDAMLKIFSYLPEMGALE